MYRLEMPHRLCVLASSIPEVYSRFCELHVQYRDHTMRQLDGAMLVSLPCIHETTPHSDTSFAI